MVPYDVQLIGGMVLHQCGITEMATGEGKTLVATLPLYLNALTGKNCQLVTVNDYLALRDSQWMGHLYEYLGLTVGCIQNSMRPDERREAYKCDITYGTNSEFGFDYLRDMGMATAPEQLVQRDHYFVLIDEVDSILIDEARTPLIISGPASVSTHKYDKLKPLIADVFKRQTLLCTRLIQEAKEALQNADDISKEDMDDAFLKMCKVHLGMPKHKQLLRLMEDPSIRKSFEKKEMEIHSDNNRGLLQKVKDTLYFAIDERGGEADLSEMGRKQVNPNDPDAFVIPDLAATFSDIDANEDLDEAEKATKRSVEQQKFDEKAEIIHNTSQLLRAFCLFEQDVHYVIQDNSILIVDENTGRLMPGRRFGEGLHMALEAKEGVKIQRETQTLASITIQNYFRMYDKLAGMTGTAETEASEFKQIYNLRTVVIPTNKPCIRKDNNDKIYKTKREKYNAIVDEIEELHKKGQPVLLGTVTVDVSEILSRLLQRRNIPHNVLNAKNHLSEAEIVARAGQNGAVTVATNMAGRGTDIKLGEGIFDLGGLHVIGSERHDSRRIDRQLRGRCSRQGDPGATRFYVSLEDNLMRLFGSDRISSIMEKLGIEEGEELESRLLTGTIQNAQKKVEQHHFSIRKHTLEYDNVMNKQREMIYGLRREILLGNNSREILFDIVNTAVAEHVENELEQLNDIKNKPAFEDLKVWLNRTFPVNFDDALFDSKDSDSIIKTIVDKVDEVYTIKENAEGEEVLRWLEPQIMLGALDQLYQEHLYAMDTLRNSVQLQAYGQKDPLVEYKRQAYGLFGELMEAIKDLICTNMFRPLVTSSSVDALHSMAAQQESHTQLGQFGGVDGGPEEPKEEKEEPPIIITIRRDMPKVGRNEPCPCGSGKKFKKCCGQQH